MATMEKLTGIFRRVFDDDSIVLTPLTTANDITGWDSLSHVNLIVAIEAAFKIEFTQQEALGFRNVGELADFIDKRLGTESGAKNVL
jgi:acyl carrier protein